MSVSMLPEKAGKRWPAFEAPEWLKVWVKGHYNASQAVYWKGEIFLVKAGTADIEEWLIERDSDGRDVLYIGSENAGLGYRSVEKFVPGDGDRVDARIYSASKHLQTLFALDEEVLAREAADGRFYDSDLEEVEDMTLKEFIEYVM